METFAGYQIKEELYSGQNTTIYRGEHTGDNTNVIIKILKTRHPTSLEISSLKREYEISHKIMSDGVVQPLAFEQSDGHVGIILEDFGGASLDKIVNKRRVGLKPFLQLAIKLSGTLGEIHNKDIIHKDIKPQNIIINKDKGTVKFTDFGIASTLGREDQSITSVNKQMEGTLYYISPEQTGRMNRAIDYRTDLYSLGITFYELLTGDVPFRSEDQMELLHSHIAKLPTPPNKIREDVPEVISNIVMKLLSKNAEDRYRSAIGLKNDLLKCYQQLVENNKIENFSIGEKDVSDKFHIPQKLYGRDDQIQTLLDGFQRVSENKSEMMLVAGFSGIGKSVLVRELHKPITRSHGYFLNGKFGQFQRNIPYSAIIEAFRELIKQILTEKDEQILNWKNKLAAALEDNGQIIVDVIPEVEYIIGAQKPVSDLPPLEAQNRFNSVFKKFIGVFTQKEHPLVIFLDDLHWADTASLSMIKTLMTDSDSKYLYLIGAYRDNEVSATHPLIITLNDIEEATQVKINSINLQPLEKDHISQLIVETLNCTADHCMPLTEMVLEKTKGNPFFVNEFLKNLYSENLLKFNLDKVIWEWDLNSIKSMAITDNVVELMTGNIKKLSPETQHVMQLASCIGSKFDLQLLSLVNEKPLNQTLSEIWQAVTEGLIITESDYSHLMHTQDSDVMGEEKVEARFLHDRVREAAYTMLPESRQSELHHKFGQLMMSHYSKEEIEENIFDVVNQYNQAVKLITDENEKKQVLELNIRAGSRAKSALAYAVAIDLFSIAKDLLPDNSWNSQYETSYNIYLNIYECENLNRNYEKADDYFQILQKNASNTVDKARAYVIRCFALNSQHRLTESISEAIRILKELGIKIREKPSNNDVLISLLRAKMVVWRKGFDSLLTAKYVDKPETGVALQIIANILTPAYLTNQPLYAVLILVMTRITYMEGNSPIAPYAIASYAVVHTTALGDYENGYRFARLAEKLLNILDANVVRAKVISLDHMMVHNWKLPWRELSAPFIEAMQAGVDVGDLEWSALAALCWHYGIYSTTPSLENIKNQSLEHREATIKLKQHHVTLYTSIYAQFIHCLLDYNWDITEMSGEYFNEKEVMAIFEKNQDMSAQAVTNIMKSILMYLLGKQQIAYEAEEKGSALRAAAPGQIAFGQSVLFQSLIYADLYPTSSQQDQKRFMKTMNANLKSYKKWAATAPENFQHKYDMLIAEKARLEGKKDLAIDHYVKAIAGAKKNGHTMDEAISNELLAKHYAAIGNVEKAKDYMTEAHGCYRGYGAFAKVVQIEDNFPDLLHLEEMSGAGANSATTTISATRTASITRSATTRHATTSTGTSTTTAGGRMDLDTIIKASQALSGEIELEKILSKMLKILIENAGATKGFLLLPKDGFFVIEAEITVDNQNLPVMQSISMDQRDDISSSVVNYVARTKENVVLNDAANEGEFVNTPYIQRSKPRSVLCIPLLTQNKMMGILYLENNISVGAFTQERLELLKVLSSQVAISIENAKLIDSLKEQERLKQEMEIAQKIQTAIVPVPPANDDLEITASMTPAEEVGGDYYDVMYDKQNRLWLAIGDVTGHGVTPGLVMMMAQTSFSSVIQSRDNVRPVDVFIDVNRVLYDNVRNRLGEDHYMTMNFLLYEGNGKFVHSGVHLDIMVFRNATQTIEPIETDGIFLSLLHEVGDKIGEREFQLEQGDIMVLYTDGVIEARNENGELLDVDRFKEIIKSKAGGTIEELKDHILKETMSWCNNKPDDDVTMIVVKRK